MLSKKQKLIFVSWRQLQTYRPPPTLCLQYPENELFCFRLIYQSSGISNEVAVVQIIVRQTSTTLERKKVKKKHGFSFFCA